MLTQRISPPYYPRSSEMIYGPPHDAKPCAVF
jgi:hypothetical protein